MRTPAQSRRIPVLQGILFQICLLSLLNVGDGLRQSQSPPQMTKEPPTDEVLFQVAVRQDENDKPFIIECEAEAEPAPRYRWIKNGKEFNWQAYDDRISQQPGRGTLVVTAPRTEDIGQYQCFATNEWGTATSNSVFVRKSELNLFKDEDPVTIIANEGEPFKLTCSPPDGWPKPKVYWMLQNQAGVLININTSRITVDPEGTLWFSNVTRSDTSSDMWYACVAYSGFRKEYRLGNRVFLNVAPTSSSAVANKHAPTLQYVSKRNTIALRGSSVNLWCIFGGTPLPEIKWTRKGDQLPKRIEYDNYGKTLRINNVQFEDEGNYDCSVSNGVGSPISYSVQLSVYSVPYFTVEPERRMAAEGDTIEFQCEAAGKPAPEIKWIHNGKPLEESDPNPRRKLVGNKIILENLHKTDTGNYGCNATNSFGYVYKDVYINVLALPAEIVEKPKDVVTTDGKSISLTCRVMGAPTPLVRWYKKAPDGTVKELTGGRFRVDLVTGDLMIRDVTLVDSGDYVCDARNRFGHDSAEGKLVVKEHTKITDKPQDYEVAAGTTATFRCSADTDYSLRPELQIHWLRNGEQIDFDAEQRYVKLQDNSLTIDKTTELDSAVYTCLAETQYDNDTASATLTVQDVPNRPELTGIRCARRDATISWKPMGDNRSPILHYTIQFNTSFTPDTWEVTAKDVPATETSYTVSMSPWSNYTFRVIARNKIGPSIPSLHSDVCTTSPDVPFKNPDNVKGHGTSPTNLVISWTPMQEIDHNAPKFKYQIQWKPDDSSSSWQLEEVKDWRQSELVIENQPTYRRYLIKVKALNEIGESNVAPSEEVGFSGQAEPTEAPDNFTLVEKLDARTAIVSWSKVRPETLRGKFEGYKIQTWTEMDGEDDKREILIKNDVNTAVIDKLVPFSKNYLVVMAYNTDHNGPPSRTIEVVTPEGTPGPVETFEGYPLGASALLLVWRKPDQPNGILTGYEIYYHNVIGTEVGILQKRDTIHDPEETRAKLAGLEPSTKYRVHVRATTKAGAGEDTFIEVSTEPLGLQTPLETPKFRWSTIKTENGLAAIRVKWVPNLQGPGRPGSHFFVQYKMYGKTAWLSTDPEMLEDFIDVRGLEQGETYVFRVVSVDGTLTSNSEEEEIYTYAEGPMVRKAAASSAGWWIGLIVAIAFLLLLLILVCIVKRNRGGKYAVYEREIAHGRLDYDEGGFREYSQPAEGGRMSGAEFKPPHESDTDSLNEYADEAARFTEDGSFIGQYGVKKKPDPNLPSPMATFV